MSILTIVGVLAAIVVGFVLLMIVLGAFTYRRMKLDENAAGDTPGFPFYGDVEIDRAAAPNWHHLSLDALLTADYFDDLDRVPSQEYLATTVHLGDREMREQLLRLLDGECSDHPPGGLGALARLHALREAEQEGWTTL